MKNFKFIAKLALSLLFAFGVAFTFQPDYNEADISPITLTALSSQVAQGEGSQGTLYGNSSGTQFCCKAGTNSCSAASC